MIVTARQAVDAIGRWPVAEQRAWRQLLDSDPAAARLMAEAAVLLDARPADDNLPSLRNPGMSTDRPRAAALRQAPADARRLLARLHHDELEEDAADAA